MKTGSEKRATKYAKALLESVKAETLRSVGAELAILAEIFSSEKNKSILEVLANPVLPFTKKQEIISSALGSHVSAPVKNIFMLLLEKGIPGLVVKIASQYEKLVNELEKLSSLHIISAKLLSDPEQNSLKDSVKQSLSSHGLSTLEHLVQFNFTIDPGLLGGLQVRCGDKLLDSSIKGAVDRIFEGLEKAV